jgi:DHA2 family multidrug resistance protein
MDQGERLDWFNSGTIVAMSAAGIFLLGASVVRRISQPNPILNLKFLNTRNIIILALSVFVFKFMHLATIVLVPGFLANVQRYRPLETGHTLAWVAIPMFLFVWLVAVLVIYTNSRLVLSVGLSLGSVCCLLYSHVDSSWAGNSFQIVELLLSFALACTYVGLVSSIVLEGLESGALTSASNAATFSGFIHFIRIFGGQVGVAVMNRVIAVREKFHSNIMVQMNEWLTDQRLHTLTAGMLPHSDGREEAQHRAVEILSQQTHAQAYTLAVSDGFIVIIWVALAYLLLMLVLKPGKITFKDLRKMV